MKLTKKDKEILKGMGYVDWDLQQIEAASNDTSYRIAGTDKTFSEEKALELLERKAFLSGLARSTFSGTSYRKELNGTRTIMIESRDFFLSKEKKDIYECFEEAVELEEIHDCDISESITLYFIASPRFLVFTNQDYDEITCAEISLEFPRNMKSLKDTSVEISSVLDGKCFDWCDFCLPYEQVDILFAIAVKALDNSQKEPKYKTTGRNESKLIDGITECCGYDFGTDTENANFCPICGKKLI